MENFVNRVIVEPFESFVERLLHFLPNLLLALLVLAGGVAAALIARFALQKLLAAIGLDRYAERSGIRDLLRKGGIKEAFSQLMARLGFWLLVIMFLIISLGTLNVPEVNELLSQFFLYLPSIIVAVAIMFVGYILSNFLSKAVLVSAVNSGIRMSGLLAKGVKLIVMLLTLTMAMEQLGIGRGTILILFSLVFGGIVFALSIAFGLGGKELAREFLEGRLKERGEDKDEISHL